MSIQKYGLSLYSDTITIDAGNHRIFVLENALVCVRTRISTVSV